MKELRPVPGLFSFWSDRRACFSTDDWANCATMVGPQWSKDAPAAPNTKIVPGHGALAIARDRVRKLRDEGKTEEQVQFVHPGLTARIENRTWIAGTARTPLVGRPGSSPSRLVTAARLAGALRPDRRLRPVWLLRPPGLVRSPSVRRPTESLDDVDACADLWGGRVVMGKEEYSK